MRPLRPSRAGARSPRAPGRPAFSPGRPFAPEVVAEAVRALESGVPAPLVCRRFGVSDRTLYRWRRRARPERRPA